MRLKALIVLVAAFAVLSSAHAMDRWAALSMIESGNDDSAIGSLGEVSRFQIRPYLWPGGNPQNAGVALDVARKIMKQRIARFEHTHNRAPSDFEFYVLWNAPQEVNHPCRAVVKRAERFANLVQRTSAGYASR
ncbi:MAG TPA: hypothetical protein VNV43_05815 [Candidatus Acidoferrales bacterium]|nr:hypothetical protein [Candidatus Acidoferrales bacterium]